MTVSRDVALEDAADLILEHNIPSLPVLDDAGRACVILTSPNIPRGTRRKKRQQASA